MSWLHLQNWLYITHEAPTDLMPLGHFWSLSVEEQFYLLWPFVVFVVSSTRYLKHIVYIILITCIFSRVSSWLIYGDGYTNFCFQYMTRLDGLCIGSLIAIWRFSYPDMARKNILRFGFIVLSIELVLFVLAKTALINFPHFRIIGYTSIAAMFGMIVLFAIEKRNAFSKFLLENSFIRYTGKISYGLYVYHVPILVLSKIFLLDKLTNKGYSYSSAYTIVSLAALAVTIPVSLASYYLFEKKILALKDIVTSDGFFERAWKKLLLFFNPSSAR
jgi:peptidoglycan/LPS O-acetylase OafA/YrhL